MIRIGAIFGIAATLAATAAFLIPLGGFQLLIAFVSLIALGWGVGYTAAKTTGDAAGNGIGRGAAAGAIAGTVVLIISTLSFLALANSAFIQQAMAEALQQSQGVVDPNGAQPTSIDPVTATIIGGAGGGFCIGLISLVLMFISGAVGGLMWKGVPSIANTGQGAYGATTVTPTNHSSSVADTRDTRRS